MDHARSSADPPAPPGSSDGPNGVQPSLARLAAVYAPHDGTFDLTIPGLHVTRSSRADVEVVHALQVPSLCLIAHGAKTLTVGRDTYSYDTSRMLVVAVALPVAARIARASAADPYLSVRLDLDPQRLSDLVLKVYPHGLPSVQERRGAYVTAVDLLIVRATARLIECLAQPGDAELLAPLVEEEILIRLLRGPIGLHVAQLGLADSGIHRVSRAIAWLRDNYAQPMRVDDLADLVHMSVSSFHEHFKAFTSMSPLQYQKALRLQEARRLMVSATVDAGTAGQLVGYASASQFSRDYGRFFGLPPARDVARLRRLPQASI